MRRQEDEPDILIIEGDGHEFAALSQRPLSEANPASAALGGPATVCLHSFDLSNQPLVSGVPGLPGEVVIARSTVSLQRDQVGSTVVVLFEQGNVRRPIIIGVVQNQPVSELPNAQARTVTVVSDNDRLELSADREIVLRCGQASITLTKAGKILIQGAYVSTRSSGVNRIKGGSVQIN